MTGFTPTHSNLPWAKTSVITYISTMQVEVCMHDRFYPNVKVATLQLPPQAKTLVVTYISTMQKEVCVHDRFYPTIKVATREPHGEMDKAMGSGSTDPGSIPVCARIFHYGRCVLGQDTSLPLSHSTQVYKWVPGSAGEGNQR